MKKPINSSILVVGLLCNAEKSIINEITRFKNSLSDFNEISFYLVESDSYDSTTSKLNFLKSNNNNFDFISLGELKKIMPERIERLTYCRNKYLDYINKNEIKYDYVIVADFDNINNKLNKKSINSCWVNGNNWDCCTANQSKLYYDIYALRLKGFCESDIWKDAIKLSNIFGEYYAFHMYSLSKMLKINRNSGLIEVESAFGGLAIYNTDCLIDIKYDYKNSNGDIICEHVILNQQIKKKGCRIVINTNLINSDWTNHTKKHKVFYFLYYTKLGRKLLYHI